MDECKGRFSSEPQLNKIYVNRVISKNYPMSRRNTTEGVRDHNYPIDAISCFGNIQEETNLLGKNNILNHIGHLNFSTVFRKSLSRSD